MLFIDSFNFNLVETCFLSQLISPVAFPEAQLGARYQASIKTLTAINNFLFWFP